MLILVCSLDTVRFLLAGNLSIARLLSNRDLKSQRKQSLAFVHCIFMDHFSPALTSLDELMVEQPRSLWDQPYTQKESTMPLSWQTTSNGAKY